MNEEIISWPRITGKGSVDHIAKVIHEVSTEHGFEAPNLDNLPEKLMLSVSELSEALEEHRDSQELVYFRCPDCGSQYPNENSSRFSCRLVSTSVSGRRCESDILKPEGILVEIADSIIRNLHMMHSLIEQGEEDLSIQDILVSKINYNATRPHKHGKAY